MAIDLEGEIAAALAACGVSEHGLAPDTALMLARAALARLESLGLVVVPKEPTEAMVNAGNDHLPPASVGNEDSEAVADAYRVMISASKP